MNMPKSRDIQAKMLSPKVILNVFWLVTVKVLNSYDLYILGGSYDTYRYSFLSGRYQSDRLCRFWHRQIQSYPSQMADPGIRTVCHRYPWWKCRLSHRYACISSQNPASFFPDRDSYDSYCGTDRRMCVFLYHQQPYTIPAGSSQSSSSRTLLSVPPEKIRHCKNT